MKQIGIYKRQALLCLAAAVIIAAGWSSQSHAREVSSRDVYERYCAGCHGMKGDGRGPAADYLSPAPRDFTLGLFKWKSTPYDEMTPSDEDLRRSIAGHSRSEVLSWTGLSGTSMPGWSDTLSAKEVDGLAAYIKSFSGLGEPSKPAIKPPKKGIPTEHSIANGERLFKDRCSECHGRYGRGDAAKKLKDDWGGRTWPRDLTKPWTFRAGGGVDDIYTRITAGIPGTQMPSFADKASKKYLTDDERMDVAGYVLMLEDVKRTPVDLGAIKAVFVESGVPSVSDDAAWDKAAYANILLFPQLMRGARLYSPSIDAVSIKALYDSKEVAFLVEWNDRTQSIPGDEKAIEIAGGPVFPDAVAMQFPSSVDGPADAAHFDMGSELSPVVIWRWQGPTEPGAMGTLNTLEASGPADIIAAEKPDAAVSASSKYDSGTWKVVFRSKLNNQPQGSAARLSGRPAQAALALWDGSNGDNGDKHAVTGWIGVDYVPQSSAGKYLWPVIAAAAVFIAGLVFILKGNKTQPNG